MWNRILIATPEAAQLYCFVSMTKLGSNLVSVSQISGPSISYDRWRQFAAILGDLEQKKDVYLAKRDFGPHIDRLFSNTAQAQYLRDFRPDLVPPCEPNGTCPSDHTLGTIFEAAYYSNIQFRTEYLQNLPQL